MKLMNSVSGMLPIKLGTQLTKGSHTWYHPNEAFSEPKSDKMEKERAILIVRSCFILMYRFGFIFYCF